ncbi:MAG: glycosyltransferase family 1 protein, partial [Deltaproteobacteria bacterium]
DVAFVHNCVYIQAPEVLKHLKTPSVYYCHEPLRRAYEPRDKAPFGKELRPNFFRKPIRAFREMKYERLIRRLDYENVRSASLVLTNSYYTREYVYHVYGIFGYVNYLGVDAELFKPLEMEKENLVLSVGALLYRKGHDFVIESVASLPKKCRPSVGIVADRGKLEVKEYLIQLAKDKGVKLVFYEKITDLELVVLYNRAKVTACAQVMEPFGFVPLESMACETPVVGVKEAGLRESIIHGVTGILTPRDPVEFGNALQHLLFDEERCRAMGHRGRMEVIANWTWERSVKCLEKYLRWAADLSR